MKTAETAILILGGALSFSRKFTSGTGGYAPAGDDFPNYNSSLLDIPDVILFS